MKDVLHKVREAAGGRGKVIIIAEHSEDKECVSDIRKKFIYVAKSVEMDGGTSATHVHIEKYYDSKTQDEFFSMMVRGFFHVYRNRRMVKVGYCHLLKIKLHWKSKSFSPKKSVTLG